MDFPTAAVLIVLIIATAIVLGIREWQSKDDPCEPIGFFHFPEQDE